MGEPRKGREIPRLCYTISRLQKFITRSRAGLGIPVPIYNNCGALQPGSSVVLKHREM